ncbi:hypothetical protein C8T65DRAFT_630243, partial [Cerioporus squamosus]
MPTTEHHHEGVEELRDTEIESVKELEGKELMTSLEQAPKSVHCELMRAKSKETWVRGESALRGVRTGRAARTVRGHRQKSQMDESEKAKIQESNEAQRFRAFFKPTHTTSSPNPSEPLVPAVQAQIAAETGRQE